MSSSKSARWDPSCPVMPVIRARFGRESTSVGYPWPSYDSTSARDQAPHRRDSESTGKRRQARRSHLGLPGSALSRDVDTNFWSGDPLSHRSNPRWWDHGENSCHRSRRLVFVEFFGDRVGRHHQAFDGAKGDDYLPRTHHDARPGRPLRLSSEAPLAQRPSPRGRLIIGGEESLPQSMRLRLFEGHPLAVPGQTDPGAASLARRNRVRRPRCYYQGLVRGHPAQLPYPLLAAARVAA